MQRSTLIYTSSFDSNPLVRCDCLFSRVPHSACCWVVSIIMQEAAGASTIFVDVLWAMVVLVGCSMSLGGCMVAYRHFKAGGGGAPMYLPVQAAVSTAPTVCVRVLLSIGFDESLLATHPPNWEWHPGIV